MGEQEIELEQENIIITAGGAVNSVNGYTGDVVLTTSDLENTSDYQNGTEVESAISTAIAGKQDTLTAGNNITISNNTISATDTTYTAGTGLDLTGTVFSVDTDTIATKQNVNDEATARENADINLQGQIDAITASSDVKDIVGTHAELEAYDTSTLQNNDIIKVLQDETEDDETTYYRWSTTTETFTLIGEEGPYYTKAATDTLLAAKQDTLTAGSNITIEEESGTGDLVISATDTTYTDFTGTDGTAAGTAGLVPAPATTDAGKFLKADGTWDDAAGSTYTAGDGIDITNDVISATNTGKARVLTTADYNWPTTGTPSSVALWLLDTGFYYATPQITVKPSILRQISNLHGLSIILGKGDTTVRSYVGEIGGGGNASHIQVFQTQINDGSKVSETTLLDSNSLQDNLTSDRSDLPLSASQGKVLKDLVDSLAIRGAGAPTTATVGQVGTLYEDTTNGDLYICTDATDPYVWEAVGGGGSGPTVVQTTGTSTTDVMSQIAVTSMVYADPSTTQKVSIGGSIDSGSAYGTAVGYQAAIIGANRAVAIGYRAGANESGSVALGTGSAASRIGEVNIGSLASTAYGFNNSNYRLLSGVYDGQSAHDAATYGQVISYAAINGAGAPTTATEGRYVGQLYYDTTNEAMYFLKTIDTTTTPTTYTWEALGGGGGGPTVVQTTGTSTTDVMSQNAVTSMVFADTATQYKVKIGADTSSSIGNNSVEIGRGAVAETPNGVAIGYTATAQSTNGATAIGYGAVSTAVGAIAISGGWNQSTAQGVASIRIGNGSNAVSGQGAISLGFFTPANTEQGKIEVGSTSKSYGYNSSNYRLISGVYDGQSAHDAATKGQLDTAIINGGTTAPTTATVGAVGTLYSAVVSNTAHLYACTAIDDTTDPQNPSYTWTTLV